MLGTDDDDVATKQFNLQNEAVSAEIILISIFIASVLHIVAVLISSCFSFLCV